MDMLMRNYNPVFSSFMTYHWVSNKSSTTDTTRGAGTVYAYHSGALEFTAGFQWSVARSLVFCVVLCGLLFILLSIFLLLGIVLSIFLLLGIVLSISLRLTASDNHFGILNTFLIYSGFQCKKDMSTSFSFPLIRTFYFDFPRFCPSIMVY